MKQTYTVPADRREDIEKLVAKYQKKAAKYGTPLTVDFGTPYFTSVPVFERGEHGVMVQTGDTYDFEAIDMTIDCEVIKKDGYTVVAKIEHLEGGKIVTVLEGDAAMNMKPEWHTMDCRCEHCGTKRDRRLTFIVRHENGEEKQVGRSCLKDYCGIDPQAIGWNNELTALMMDYDVRNYDFGHMPISRAYDTVEALAVAIRIVNAQGYVRSGEPGANRDMIADELHSNRPTEVEKGEAANMAKTIAEMTDEDAVRFMLDNVKVLLNNTYCKANHFGYIAYAPVAYEKYLAELKRRADREAERAAQAATSDYVGNIGERLTFQIAEMTLVTSWENDFGRTYLYKFLDTNGNVLVWFASKTIDDATAIKATVKDHTERDGVKQTIITRCKVA